MGNLQVRGQVELEVLLPAFALQQQKGPGGVFLHHCQGLPHYSRLQYHYLRLDLRFQVPRQLLLEIDHHDFEHELSYVHEALEAEDAGDSGSCYDQLRYRESICSSALWPLPVLSELET